MNAITRFTVTPTPCLATIEPLDNLHVRVTWSVGARIGRIDDVDLSPLINSFKFYRPIRNNDSLFRTVHLIDDGFAIAWANDEIDMASTSVQRLAEEMMTADDFRDFLLVNKFTHGEAAAILGRSRRQIENYLAGERIPRIVVLACFGLKYRQIKADSLQTTTETPGPAPELNVKLTPSDNKIISFVMTSTG